MNGVHGRAATGLQDSSWAANDGVAKVGAKGEHKTEALLNGFGKKAAVLHDLRIPIPGFQANVDHAVVSGKSVLLIDSKMWKPGFYWSLLGYRRGWEKTPHVGKSQEYVSRAMNSFLQGTGARVLTPRLVVWSSRDGQPLSTWLLTVQGAEVVDGLRIVLNMGYKYELLDDEPPHTYPSATGQNQPATDPAAPRPHHTPTYDEAESRKGPASQRSQRSCFPASCSAAALAASRL